jgi:hypothetical protein
VLARTNWAEVAPSDYIDEGEEGPSDEASGGEYVDEGEGENAGIGTLTARRRLCHGAENTSVTSQMRRTS